MTNGNFWEGAAIGLTVSALNHVVHNIGDDKPKPKKPSKTQTEKCPTCLNPSTVGKNIFGLSYPGPNNPRSYNGDYDYTAFVKEFSEIPAITHDMRYDKLGVEGAGGLFLDKRAIGADWAFVRDQFSIVLHPLPFSVIGFWDRTHAAIFGTGLALAASQKTVAFFVTTPLPLAIPFVSSWFNISNQGIIDHGSFLRK